MRHKNRGLFPVLLRNLTFVTDSLESKDGVILEQLGITIFGLFVTHLLGTMINGHSHQTQP